MQCYQYCLKKLLTSQTFTSMNLVIPHRDTCFTSSQHLKMTYAEWTHKISIILDSPKPHKYNLVFERKILAKDTLIIS